MIEYAQSFKVGLKTYNGMRWKTDQCEPTKSYCLRVTIAKTTALKHLHSKVEHHEILFD